MSRYHIMSAADYELRTAVRQLLWNPMLASAQRDASAKVRIKVNNSFNKHDGDIMRDILTEGRIR